MTGVPHVCLYLLAAATCKAVTAEYRTIRFRLERNASFLAAICTDSGEIFSRSAGRVFAGVTAGLATLRLVLETALCIKLLLTCGKNEFFSAFLAYHCLVFEHDEPLF